MSHRYDNKLLMKQINVLAVVSEMLKRIEGEGLAQLSDTASYRTVHGF